MGQLPRAVNGGPLMVWSPRGLSDDQPVTEEVAKSRKLLGDPATVIRTITQPARAKRIMDEVYVRVSANNARKAVQTAKALGLKPPERSAVLGYLSWSPWEVWKSRPLSDLEKYTPEERDQLKAFLKAENWAVIENNFTQENLDGVLARIKAGERPPAATPALQDPGRVAKDVFVAGVKNTVTDYAEDVQDAAIGAATAVGSGIKTLYDKGKEVVGSAFGWLGKLKWIALIGLGGAGLFVAWPYLKAARAPGKWLASKT